MREPCPLVSIVVPVYNSATTLRQCLDSLCRQTYRNTEILCLDDAATDDSGNILSTYAEQDPRIRIVTNNSNLGLFATRCRGFSMARGEYFTTCDADDCMPPNAVRALCETAVRERADLVHGVARALGVAGHGKRLWVFEPFSVSSGRAYVAAFLRNRRGWNVWGKLYHRCLWENASANLPRDKRWFLGEDLLFSFAMGPYAKRYRETGETVYTYRVPRGGYFCDSRNGSRNIHDHVDILAHMMHLTATNETFAVFRTEVELLSLFIVSVIWRECGAMPGFLNQAAAIVSDSLGERFLPVETAGNEKKDTFGRVVCSVPKKLYSCVRGEGFRELWIGLHRACGAAKKRGWGKVLREFASSFKE